MSQMNFTLHFAGPGRQNYPPNPMQSCRKNDTGIILNAILVDANNNPINIRAATKMLMKIVYPDGASKDVKGSWLTNGLDGQVAYVTTAADLPQEGLHKLQVELTMFGSTQSTEMGKFWVGELADLN